MFEGEYLWFFSFSVDLFRGVGVGLAFRLSIVGLYFYLFVGGLYENVVTSTTSSSTLG